MSNSYGRAKARGRGIVAAFYATIGYASLLRAPRSLHRTFR
jgi:hypothetical protein